MNSFSFDDEPDVNLDLTPLIDTVFMLLIFFIMATTFSKPVLEVALQEATGAAVQKNNQEPLTITITQQGSILCNEQVIAAEELNDFLAGRPKEEGVLFRVDKRAPFGSFVAALDAVKKLGKENMAIETEHHEK